MNSQAKIRVMLAGGYPLPGGMTGTYGRILNNILASSIFRDEVDFIPHRVTLPADGSLPKRFAVDMVRFARSLPRKPQVLHFLMHKYRALYREYPMLTAARFLGIKTIVDVRAGTLQYMLNRRANRLENAMMSDLLRHGDAIALECRKDVPFIRERFGREAVYVPNALLEEDFDRIQPASLPPAKGQTLKMIHSGRYSQDKGVAVMLRSLNVFSERGIKVELHLTGQGTDPEILSMIRAYVSDPPQGTVVKDHGWDVEDLYALLASAHVFLMPTHWPGEGHPNSVTEAMLAGLGMILSDWFHREDIVPAPGAIIIPPRDPGALADAVQRYIDNPALLAEAGRVNREYVKANYLDSVCYPRFLKLYRQLAGGPSL
ncbi:MAG: glycosyltransferase family 4 protein [Phycisphaerae bacterium]|nr:glycosyltransferase family 4 protein [Phycisphaerae bacterium]